MELRKLWMRRQPSHPQAFAFFLVLRESQKNVRLRLPRRAWRWMSTLVRCCCLRLSSATSSLQPKALRHQGGRRASHFLWWQWRHRNYGRESASRQVFDVLHRLFTVGGGDYLEPRLILYECADTTTNNDRSNNDSTTKERLYGSFLGVELYVRQ